MLEACIFGRDGSLIELIQLAGKAMLISPKGDALELWFDQTETAATYVELEHRAGLGVSGGRIDLRAIGEPGQGPSLVFQAIVLEDPQRGAVAGFSTREPIHVEVRPNLERIGAKIVS